MLIFLDYLQKYREVSERTGVFQRAELALSQQSPKTAALVDKRGRKQST